MKKAMNNFNDDVLYSGCGSNLVPPVQKVETLSHELLLVNLIFFFYLFHFIISSPTSFPCSLVFLTTAACLNVH
jgi:hypothetical protein